jgi:hypothetical protein
MLSKPWPHINTFSELFVSKTKPILNNIFGKRDLKLLTLLLSLLLILATIELYDLNNPVKVSNNNLRQKSENQLPIVVYTPKEALNFIGDSLENSTSIIQEDKSTNTPNSTNKNIPERPGVIVFTEPTSKSKKSNQDPDNSRQVPIPQRPAQNNPSSLPRESSTQNNQYNKIQSIQSEPVPLLPKNLNNTNIYHGASIGLLSITPQYSTNGVSYQITLRAQNNGGKLIHWESVTVSALGMIAPNSIATSRFINQLGSPGSITFTLKSPSIPSKFGKTNTTLRCSLQGRTVDNLKVSIAILIPTHS